MSHPTLELKSTYLALRRALERTVKPFGFSAGQFDVLQLLMHDAEIEHRDLQRRLSVTSPTLTNVVDGLARSGHVVRRTSDADARVKTIAITDSAKHICFSKEFCDAGDDLVDKMFAGMTVAERRQFLGLLGRVRDNLEDLAD